MRGNAKSPKNSKDMITRNNNQKVKRQIGWKPVHPLKKNKEIKKIMKGKMGKREKEREERENGREGGRE